MNNPQQHHNKRHRSLEQPFETCLRCGRDKATCRKKIRLTDWQEANEWIESRNAERLWMPPYVAWYRCRWCGGAHMKTARDPRSRARMEKLARKRQPEIIRQLHRQLASDLRSFCVKQSASVQ